MRPYLTLGQHGHTVRLRWSRVLPVSAVFLVSGNTATCRGPSEILQAFLPCASIPWDQWCLLRIEQWLSTTLKCHCAREARELKLLPMPRICSRMVLEGLPPNTGSCVAYLPKASSIEKIQSRLNFV